MARVKRKCEKTGKEIPLYLGMNGAGFQSIKRVEQPQIKIEGKFVPQPDRHLELCAEAYLDEFKEAYPGKPLPKLPPVLPEDDE